MKIAHRAARFPCWETSERNKDKMLLALAEAKEKGADIVVFAELAVCGYPPRDFLEFPHFLHLCYQAVDAIAEASRGIASVIGAPRS